MNTVNIPFNHVTSGVIAAPVLNFADITTAKQLRRRIEAGALSVGSKIHVVRAIGTRDRLDDDQVETRVTFTSRYGNTTQTWFI